VSTVAVVSLVRKRLKGGAELHAWNLASHLAIAAHGVEVLTDLLSFARRGLGYEHYQLADLEVRIQCAALSVSLETAGFDACEWSDARVDRLTLAAWCISGKRRGRGCFFCIN